jgi:hypothetical protein
VVNARVDELGEELSHRILHGDLLQEIFPSQVLEALKGNLSHSLAFKSGILGGKTLTFSANTKADLGEQEPICETSDESDRVTPCDRIGAKATLCEYTKNKVVRHLS